MIWAVLAVSTFNLQERSITPHIAFLKIVTIIRVDVSFIILFYSKENNKN